MRPQNEGRVSSFVQFTALYYLSTGGTYAEVAASMRDGISPSTVMEYVRTFTTAVVEEMSDNFIRFPCSSAALDQCARSMEGRSGIPRIIGALDSTHIAVHPQHDLTEGYRNYKNYYSVVLQAVVGPRGLFICIHCGFPGKTHDSKVLRNSNMWMHHRKWFSSSGYSVYGDAAYPLLGWLLTGFRNRQKSTDQIMFNRQGSRARVIAEW